MKGVEPAPGGPALDAWRAELSQPTGGFFDRFAECVRAPEGARDATREALKSLVPVVDWAGYLPHLPSGLLGTWGVWRLRTLLEEASFLRLLAIQLHAFAHEARKVRGGLAGLARGTGAWARVEAAAAERRPAQAYAELLGIDGPGREDFQRVLQLGAGDMACMGHKGGAAWFLGDLWERLDRPRATGRRLLAIAGWLVAAEPVDRFWQQRAAARFPAGTPAIDCRSASDPDAHARHVRGVCDLGLVALLDAFCGWMADGAGSGDLLSTLALAASEKLLDARRDLEGRTGGTLLYLAAVAHGLAPLARPEPYAQAAALVNLFPRDEPGERIQARAPAGPSGDPAHGLLEAILDAEPAQAMFHADRLRSAAGTEAVLRMLAEAASRNDPAFNHSSQALAVASAAELLPLITAEAQAALLAALAKSLANSQGSADLGRAADRALRGPATL